MNVVSKLFLLLTSVSLICVENIVKYFLPTLQQTGLYFHFDYQVLLLSPVTG